MLKKVNNEKNIVKTGKPYHYLALHTRLYDTTPI